jgi:hypothetical protein
MSQPAHAVWSGLSTALKQQVIADIVTIYTEVIHERIRMHHAFPPRSTGAHLHPPIQPTPGTNQSREP